MTSIIKTVSLATIMLALAACGSSKQDRALSGAAIGAGVGAVGTSLTGGNALGGALVGGAVGGAAGALTDENDVNLGKPAWR